MSEETLNEKMSDLSEAINESQANAVGTPTSKQHKERMINWLKGSLDWFFDPIKIAGVNSTLDDESTNITFKVEFRDFMGLVHRIDIQREDIYLSWPSVLARLVRQGYRYNVLEDGERYVRAFLAHASVTQEATERALERNQKKQKAGQVIEEATQKMVHMMSKERINLLRRNSN